MKGSWKIIGVMAAITITGIAGFCLLLPIVVQQYTG